MTNKNEKVSTVFFPEPPEIAKQRERVNLWRFRRNLVLLVAYATAFWALAFHALPYVNIPAGDGPRIVSAIGVLIIVSIGTALSQGLGGLSLFFLANRKIESGMIFIDSHGKPLPYTIENALDLCQREREGYVLDLNKDLQKHIDEIGILIPRTEMRGYRTFRTSRFEYKVQLRVAVLNDMGKLVFEQRQLPDFSSEKFCRELGVLINTLFDHYQHLHGEKAGAFVDFKSYKAYLNFLNYQELSNEQRKAHLTVQRGVDRILRKHLGLCLQNKEDLRRVQLYDIRLPERLRSLEIYYCNGKTWDQPDFREIAAKTETKRNLAIGFTAQAGENFLPWVLRTGGDFFKEDRLGELIREHVWKCIHSIPNLQERPVKKARAALQSEICTVLAEKLDLHIQGKIFYAQTLRDEPPACEGEPAEADVA